MCIWSRAYQHAAHRLGLLPPPAARSTGHTFLNRQFQRAPTMHPNTPLLSSSSSRSSANLEGYLGCLRPFEQSQNRQGLESNDPQLILFLTFSSLSTKRGVLCRFQYFSPVSNVHGKFETQLALLFATKACLLTPCPPIFVWLSVLRFTSFI